MNAKIKSFLRICIGVGGFAFIAQIFYSYHQEIKQLLSVANYKMILASIPLAITANILTGDAFSKYLIIHGVKIEKTLGIRLFMLSQVGKYIPGKIWSYAYQWAHLPEGKKMKPLAMANIDLMAISLWRNIVLGATILLLYYHYYLLAFLCILSGLAISLILSHVHHWKLVKFLISRRSIDENRDYSHKLSKHIFFVIWLAGLISIVSQYMLVRHGLGIEKQLVPLVIGINLISWVISALAFVFPAGIGIREYSFIKIADYLGVTLSLAASVTLTFRIWWVFVDISSAGCILLLRNEKKT